MAAALVLERHVEGDAISQRTETSEGWNAISLGSRSLCLGFVAVKHSEEQVMISNAVIIKEYAMIGRASIYFDQN